MDGEDHNDNPSPGGGMDEDQQQLHEMDGGSHIEGSELDMEGAEDSQEMVGDEEDGEDAGPDGDDEEAKGGEEGDNASPTSKKSRSKSMKKKSSMKNGAAEAEKSKDLSKEPRLMWMMNQLEEHLGQFVPSEMWQPQYYQWLLDFLEKPENTKLFFWIENEQIIVNYNPPHNISAMGINIAELQICYFLKKRFDLQITAANIQDILLVGLVDGDPLDDLLNQMNSDYLPKLLGEKNWPEGVKKEFVAQLHKFMAALTEASHASKGRTTLYIPNEDLSDIEAAAKDKDLLQRLESTVIYWTRQIKEVTSTQHSQNNAESTSPLDEIKHWTSRTQNLNILNIQLQKPELMRILQVLKAAGSSYLPGFRELERKIKEGHDEANDNLMFLNTLAEPCRKIENSEPKDIPKLLPDVLNSVRIIWELSRYYNTEDRMKGLLTKISNQIIKRCRAKINKDDMLDGDVEKCMSDLDESIACCKEWKTICLKMQGLIKKYSPKTGWNLDKDETIFAENEAFIQRCKDLKEICEGQLQFARKSPKIRMPIFGGTKGPEIKQGLQELEGIFEKNLQNIKNLGYDFLDVKITKWHDDYGQVFKEKIKDLEIIYQNIIALTFKSVSTVSDAIEMLENFNSLAKRPMVKDYVQKKAAEWVYKLFMDEIKEVEELFENPSKKKPPMPVSHPKFGGLAIWAQSLIVRIDKAKQAINGLYFIPEHPHAKDAMEKYQKLRTSLDNYISQIQYNHWKNEINSTMAQQTFEDKLEVPILVRRTESEKRDLPPSIANNPLFQKSTKSGLLESNFDPKLLKVIIEVQYWTKIQSLGYITIPHHVSKLLGKKEQLRILRENVMLIVRDYNTIVHTISDKEKLLFKEHLDLLDRTIEPGIKRFNWGAAADAFVYTCRRECQEVFKKVKKFQKNQNRISEEFEKIHTTTLTQIQKKLYSLKDFIKEQEDCLKQKESDFQSSFEIIKNKMMKTYDLFIQRGPKIQAEWLSFVHRLDRDLEKSLKQSVKNTLTDLSKHIRGDSKQDLVPIFKVMTVLIPDDSMPKWPVVHEPTHEEMQSSIQRFIKKIIQVVRVVPRIEKIFRDEREKKIALIKKEIDEAEKSGGAGAGGRFGAGGAGARGGAGAAGGRPGDMNFQNMSEEEKEEEWKKRWMLPKPYEPKPEYEDRIQKNKGINTSTIHIIEGIESISKNMKADIDNQMNSEEYRQVSSFRFRRDKTARLAIPDQDDLLKYKDAIELLTEVMNDIKNKQSQKPELFIILDCSRIKNTLLDLANKLIQQQFERLIKDAKHDLNSLLQEFADTVEELKTPSTDLAHLKKNKDKYAEVKSKIKKLDDRREPIRKKFQYIIEQEQDITIMSGGLTEEDKQKLATLDDAWNKFNEGLGEAFQIINKSYISLKAEMDHTIDDFKKEVQENKRNFQQQAPYAVDKSMDNSKAKEKLQEFKAITKELREKEEDMKFGLDIFEIEPVQYHELAFVEKEMAQLNEIWSVKEEWDGEWDAWKIVSFYDLKIDDMDDRAVEFQEKIKNFDKEVRQWGVFDYLKNRIDQFRAAMPLIADLRDEAMRERHWKELKFEVKEEFDENSPEFTLEKIFDLGLNNHGEKVAELADNARKELKIEIQLEEIRRIWEEDPVINLEMQQLKSKANGEEYYKISSTDNIYGIIENHVVMLSNQKSSPYYKQFDDKIDFWENAIAQITETLELLITVQGKWSYLESIFRGQQDISKQLPNESSVFTKINTDFKNEMERINKDRNAYRALNVKGFINVLQELNKKLEYIQKNLNQFLEGKRVLFPRFYFLSNDDLLEIIGQAKEPEPIQKHIKKIFEGTHELGITTTGRGQNKQHEISQLKSSDGETVDLRKSITINERVESWLKQLMDGMRDSLKYIFFKFYQDNMQATKKLPEREKLQKIISSTQGQVLITCAQMAWTTEVTQALIQLEATGQVNALKKARATYKKKVENYVELVEKPGLPNLVRIKLIALITIEEHNREIVERLYQQKIQSPRHFEWLQQLRFRKASGDENEALLIQVDQTNCVFDYGYEYQGNNGRLVVTALTDRAYMTLTNALNMCRGGAPQGPAGTGKTETVKDLGKNLAFFVVIQNCSDTMDYISIGKTFAGLALSGTWGCFDEFNRIELEVLSVVAQQVLTILDALKKGEQVTPFMDGTIQVQKDVGLFITMNPGYAGRSELPDNLKALFRPVAMMVPDFNTIAKIILMSEGFKQNDALAKKVVTIYELMKKQLSKQDHYDFGMRAVKSVLNASGRVKRERPDLDEFSVAIKAIRDMNLSKFIAEDVVLFDNLFVDLFPGCDEPDNDNDDLLLAIEDSLRKRNLQLNENLVVKIFQLYENKVTRHGNMLVGATMSGKTTCWEILCDALNLLNAEEREKGVKKEDCKYQSVKWEALNPKSISTDELYGYFDDASPPQWHDGILSSILKRICQENNHNQWMIIDGPVDTLWIESMNSVLDDSKLLTLNNGDRIGLSRNVRLLFEVENLAVASPATVSRAGMIYLDIEELGWRPFVSQWIAAKPGTDDFREFLDSLFEKYVPKVLKVKKTSCKELTETSETACVMNLCKLYDGLCKNLKKADDEEQDAFLLYVEKWFVFCLIWSIGATVEEESRREIDYILRDIESMFPHQNTVFEHYINTEKKDWSPWEEKLQANWKPVEKEFHKISVPTIDTVRNRFIVQTLLDARSQVLLVGHSGVGKTVLIDGILMTLDSLIHSFSISFSAGTTSEITQEIIETNFERRAKNKYRPKNAKIKAICFIDDLNMPKKDTFGSHPPLELIRQWIDYGFWYDRAKILPNQICDLQVLSAMGKPGGGRSEISKRLQSKFHIVNYTIPTEAQMKKIFETIAAFKFQIFDEEIKVLSEPMAMATINLFNIIQLNFLPTPAKSHYVFNMRDISKVFQGLYQADKNFYEGKEQIIKLWAHEVLRVFSDRLNSFEDRDQFKAYLNEQIQQQFQLDYKEHCMTNGEDAIFVDFLNENMRVYEEVTNFDRLREFLIDKLEQYNTQPKLIKMDLVLFKDAITHVTKIYRVLNLKRGHCFLVGVGGSGRHSLSRLSAFISEMNIFQLEVTKGFQLKQFREFMKTMYEMSAYKGKNKLKSVFIFSDNDVVHESFLEDVNNQLSSGSVPNLYAADELAKVREEARKPYKQAGGTLDTPDAIQEFFFNRVKDNLHIAICMSPIGQAFRDYCRMFPALINNTTINWFMRWPDDALTEVALKFVSKLDMPQEYKSGLSRMCCFSHQTVIDSAALMEKELKRVFYVTPTNYIELLKGFDQIITAKRTQVGNQITKLRNGLAKLDDARKQVEQMTGESEIKRIEVSKQQKICEELAANIQKEKKTADEKQKHIEGERVIIEKEKADTEKLAADAEAELKKAEPALLAAQSAVESLDKNSINEIKSYANPPQDVATVMSAVMIMLGKEPTWASAKKELANPKFVDFIMFYDKENIQQKTLKAIEKFTKLENFNPEFVGQKSSAAGKLCLWVRSIEDYAKALKVVGPKREKKAYAEEQLRKKIEYLQSLENEFKIVADRLAELDQNFQKTNSEMAAYKAELDDLQTKIDRGEQLVTGLGGEKTRWEASLIDLESQYEKLVGDCILAAAFMSYCGPFPSEYRDDLVANWKITVESEKIPYTQKFEFSEFLAGAALAQEWQMNGLPTDKFSFENGVFVTKGLRWALNIDPQTQANNWIKKMCGEQLVIADFKDSNYIRKIESGIQLGKQVLLQDVEQELDPMLDNVLNKSIVWIGKRGVIKLGGNDIEYHKNFKLYITTRMSNPHYTPEVSTKVVLVNFTVKESGLEEQCLGIVVKQEQPTIEQKKNQEVKNIAINKQTLIDLEDKILRLLSESKGNLLEDVTLNETLKTSKKTSEKVKSDLESAEQTMKRIDETRETYRICGRVASILFFVLNDLNKIDPMYQFSLDWYKELFQTSIEESRNNNYGDRIKNIIKTHQLKVYKQVCRSLFEKHKILLSLQMCVKLKMSEGEINEDEWSFFLRGGLVMDRSTQPPKPPFDWITTTAWDNITELEKQLPSTFSGIPNAITLNPKEWQRWFLSTKPEPENAQFPGEWETKCEDRLKKMIVVRCLRPDRVIFAIRNFVEYYMKKEFIENKPTNLEEVFNESRPDTPIIFVLSPGVDPTDQLKKLAEKIGQRIESISLGRGQSDKAKRILSEGAEKGNWVFLANCHLSISLLPELESMIDDIFKKHNDPNFRLFLSASPHPNFPISLLQRSLKITQEPPKGIKANMLRLFDNMGGEFQLVDQDRNFRKSVYGLIWFHAVLIERKKFKTLGWNVSYDFNDSDYSVCEDLLAIYMGRYKDGKPIETYDKKAPLPWQAIQYLIAEANYGGRITDDRDRRLIKVYAKEIFNENLISPDRWKPPGTEELNYGYPADEINFKGPTPAEVFTPSFFYDEIDTKMESIDQPAAYGQHVNAEITSQILDSNELLESILSLQPQKVSNDGESREAKVLKMINDLAENIPQSVDIGALKYKLRNDDNPLNVVLVQELQRYNILLATLRSSLEQLEKGIKGLVLISPDLEAVLSSLSDNKVPRQWGKFYFSLKPLATWMRDLSERYNFFAQWALKTAPNVFWIGAFTYPTGFTTSLLQRFSRRGGAPSIDKLEFDFIPIGKAIKDITEPPKDGSYISGLYLEGAKWNFEKMNLMEPEVMELTVLMPVIQFKPIQKRIKPPANVYECPCYYYPIRQGTVDRDSFMLKVDLKLGDQPAEYWIKRGTALVMSLAN